MLNARHLHDGGAPGGDRFDFRYGGAGRDERHPSVPGAAAMFAWLVRADQSAS